MTTGTFTEQDTQTFATKLEAFSQTLTTGEQAILTMIETQLGTLATTTTTDDDVQGYMMDLGTLADIRQRELRHAANQYQAGAVEPTTTRTSTGDRAGFWQRITLALGTQTAAMAPRATGTATG